MWDFENFLFPSSPEIHKSVAESARHEALGGMAEGWSLPRAWSLQTFGSEMGDPTEGPSGTPGSPTGRGASLGESGTWLCGEPEGVAWMTETGFGPGKFCVRQWSVLSHPTIPCPGTFSPGWMVLWDSEKSPHLLVNVIFLGSHFLFIAHIYPFLCSHA